MDNSILLVAKQEYTNQLQDILLETMFLCFSGFWDSKTYTPLKDFQKKMCDIPVWNQNVIDAKVSDIITSNKVTTDFLDKLIEAVFLSNIKILSVVKLSDKRQTVNVKVPSTRNFIHKIYIECARAFYSKPYLFDPRGNEQSRETKIKDALTIISESIDKTIRNLIPMEDILNEYLNASEQDQAQDQAQEEKPEIFDVEEPDFDKNEPEEEAPDDEARDEDPESDDEFMRPPPPPQAETMNIPMPAASVPPGHQSFYD